jgi:hypothetical protein
MGRMMKLQDVILKVLAKRITGLEAAEIIGVCDRTMRRMRERCREFGYAGLSISGAGSAPPCACPWRPLSACWRCIKKPTLP